MEQSHQTKKINNPMEQNHQTKKIHHPIDQLQKNIHPIIKKNYLIKICLKVHHTKEIRKKYKKITIIYFVSMFLSYF